MRKNLVAKKVVKEKLKEKKEKDKLRRLVKVLIAKGIITEEDIK